VPSSAHLWQYAVLTPRHTSERGAQQETNFQLPTFSPSLMRLYCLKRDFSEVKLILRGLFWPKITTNSAHDIPVSMLLTFRFCLDWELRAMKTQALGSAGWFEIKSIIFNQGCGSGLI
jgi:hypothetical protein